MSFPVKSSQKIDLVIVKCSNNDYVENISLFEEADEFAYQRLCSEKKRRLFLFRRSTLLFIISYLYDKPTLLRDSAGHIRALLSANTGKVYYISTSASKTIAATAISNEPIGIDIEKLNNQRNWFSLFNFIYFHNQKKINLPLPDIAKFEACIAWTRIEAELKRKARGLYDYLTRNSIDSSVKQKHIYILATFEWVCTISYTNDIVHISPQFLDYGTLYS